MEYRFLTVNSVELKIFADGRIETTDRVILQTSSKKGTYPRLIKGKTLLPVKNGKAGYYQVKIWYEGKSKACFVHRLVWIAFNGEIPSGYEIDHKDEDKANNALSNLQLFTRGANMTKMFKSNPHVLQNLNRGSIAQTG